MKNRLEDSMDAFEASIRYCFQCKACLDRMEYSGTGGPPDTRDSRVV